MSQPWIRVLVSVLTSAAASIAEELIKKTRRH